MPWSGIVEKVRQGNDVGVEALYAAVSTFARAQLFHSVDPQAIDDHIQEIMLIVLAAIQRGELRDPECLMGFVRTVTRRQATVHIRSAIRRRRWMISVDSSFVPVAPLHESPEARWAFQERVSAVQEIMSRLRPRDREILDRFYYDEQNSRQICLEMSLTATQFRLYKSRALAKCAISHKTWPQSTRPCRIA